MQGSDAATKTRMDPSKTCTTLKVSYPSCGPSDSGPNPYRRSFTGSEVTNKLVEGISDTVLGDLPDLQRGDDGNWNWTSVLDTIASVGFNMAWVGGIIGGFCLVRYVMQSVADNRHLHVATLEAIEKSRQSWDSTSARAINLASSSRSWRAANANQRQELAAARENLQKKAFEFRRQAAAAALRRKKSLETLLDEKAK